MVTVPALVAGETAAGLVCHSGGQGSAAKSGYG
jgi:hypothetical protein